MKIEWNQKGLDELQRNLEQQFAKGITVPLHGSEGNSVQSVNEQLVALGAEANNEGVRAKVREVRAAHGLE